MIVGAAVCPGAPFLIDGTADTLAARMQQVVGACRAALSRLPAADELLLLTTAPPTTASAATSAPSPTAGGPTASWTMLAPGTRIPSSPLRRSDRPGQLVTLPGGPADLSQVHPSPLQATADPPASVATFVGTHLLAELPTPAPPTTAVQISGDPAGAAAVLANRIAPGRRVAVLAIADGSACHGDDAPGRRDDRAAAFDAAVATALSAGDPAALATATGQRRLAGELHATIDPLSVLAGLTRSCPPDHAELLYAGAPLGVGYLVASWRWDPA